MMSSIKDYMEWVNANLNTIATNQAMIYDELLKIEENQDHSSTANATDPDL